jgi:signal transduction histidine kinase
LITDAPNHENHGIGIGLSTAKMLCEALGGKIEINSNKSGTRVKFTVLTTNEECNSSNFKQ